MGNTSVVYLPNGQTLTTSSIFGGVYFRSNDLSVIHPTSSSSPSSSFPPGWSVVLNTEEYVKESHELSEIGPDSGVAQKKKKLIHPYRKPTLQNDHLFISSISQPPSSEFKPATSQSRQIAMMLWATLYWYFQQQEPELYLTSDESEKTPLKGRPKGDWRIKINREGIFKGRLILPKLERMGLISSLDSSVGVNHDDRSGEGWLDMFVSRKSFWQLDARIYLFTLASSGSPWPGGTPNQSRPGSPSRQRDEHNSNATAPTSPAALTIPTGTAAPMAPTMATIPTTPMMSATASRGTSSPNPFTSSSHLPTFYPPHPPQFTTTAGVRHPIRPKPGRQGEILYNRFVPSVHQYLSFRIASLSPTAQSQANRSSMASIAALSNNHLQSLSDSVVPTFQSLHIEDNDIELMTKWMNDARVDKFWMQSGPQSKQEAYLKDVLKSKHSIPLIGCWDGKPFGYFEVYWVKENRLGVLIGDAGNYDRGIHCLVGEQEFRGPHRVKIWLSSLLHYCWLADNRTEVVMIEPRVDNDKMLHYCRDVGFYKEKEIAFPNKQSNLLKIKRDSWEAPAL